MISLHLRARKVNIQTNWYGSRYDGIVRRFQREKHSGRRISVKNSEPEFAQPLTGQ